MDIFNKVKAFYNDINFRKVHNIYGRTTVFNILGVERSENRHSSFLKWLFDIKGSHDMGDEPLRKFLRLVANGASLYNKENKIGSKFEMAIGSDVQNMLVVGSYTIDDFSIVTEQPIKVTVEDNKGKDTTVNGRIDVYARFMLCPVKVKDSGDSVDKYWVQVVLENKMYTTEHSDQTRSYYLWAENEAKEHLKDDCKSVLIGVFLSPDKTEDCSADTDNFEYVKITYEDLLKDVLEPLQGSEMSNEGEMMLNDYIVNLGQPSKEDDKKMDTVMATSLNNQRILSDLYKSHRQLLVAALYASDGEECYKKAIVAGDSELGITEGEIKSIVEENRSTLTGFLDTNKKYLQLIFKYNGITSNEYTKAWSVLLELATSHVLSVYRFDGKDIKGKSSLANAIIRKYAENPQVTLESLHNMFDKTKGLEKLLRGGHVIDEYNIAKTITDEKDNGGGNYNMKDVIRLTDGTDIVVWKYWPSRYFNPFMKVVKNEMKYDVRES